MLVSLLIPTHNRANLIGTTLESCRRLRIPPGVDVELIVVANACEDQTSAVVSELITRMPFPTRLVEDEVPGSSRARNRLADEAGGDLLAYLDDDVLVDPGWLEGIVSTFTEHPADLVCGPVELWWRDVERPDWFGPELESVVARKYHGKETIELSGFSGAVTANLAMRRAVFDTVGQFRTELERRGTRMGSSEDMDFLFRAQAAGFRLFYHPEATVRHWVDPHRLTYEYICGTAFGNGATRIFMKDRFGPVLVTRAILGHTYLLVRHAVGEGLAYVTGDQRSLWKHRFRRVLGLGGLHGTFLRLIGHRERP